MIPVELYPFVTGWTIVQWVALYTIYDRGWKQRHNVKGAVTYDSDLHQAYNCFKETNWKWGNIIGIPIVVGLLTFTFWWLIALAMGVSV